MSWENVATGWPDADDEEGFDAVARDEAALGPGVRALCAELGVTGPPVRYPGGSLPVYAIGDVVLKLFPPVHAEQWPVESGVLTAVQDRLPVPTPRVHATGTFARWGYVLMDRLRGVPLSECWSALGPAERDRVADQVGEAIAALHAVPVPEIDDWWPEDWPEFVAGQVAGCAGRQRALGLGPEWVAQIPGFLAGPALGGERPVLLHTEIIAEHLLVDGGRVTGLIDFEPALRGAPEYDFVGPAVLGGGDPRFLGRLLRAYGIAPDQELRRRLLGWTLLHFYSNLPAYLSRLPAPAEPTLEALADRWFATE